MASLIEKYEYDIFISYRQKDNKADHWVTQFVDALKSELEATFKEDISIYFDLNPDTGLHQNHDVDESLKEKVKCLIFIPIISQTYCDENSFAWKHEFVAFKNFAAKDRFGLKIKLSGGNVASRVLPVCIHELEVHDKNLLEKELGTALRGIEFIYKSAGVCRPLKATEVDAKGNLNRTFYGDQINKTARSIKELIGGIQSGSPSFVVREPKNLTNPQPATKRKLAYTAALLFVGALAAYGYYYAEKRAKPVERLQTSIAVLPFENMNNDPEQDYFSSGIAEDILNHLTKISDLQVKSRTSTLQYKGTQKSVTEIGEELNVDNIIEGSVRRVGDKVRIVVQLIDTKTDLHLWSETYDRELQDVLTVQSEIAIEIARALQARLTSSERQQIYKEVTTDVTAYDYYLRVRDGLARISDNKDDYLELLALINKALSIDRSFSKAYALKGEIWFQLAWFGLPQATWQDSVFANTKRSIALDPETSDGYLVEARVHHRVGNLSAARASVTKAYALNPKDLAVQTAYGYELLRNNEERGADMVIRALEKSYSTKQSEYYETLASPFYFAQDYDGAINLLQEAVKLNPKSAKNHYELYNMFVEAGRFQEAESEALLAFKLNPEAQGPVDNLAWAYFRKKDYQKAIEYWSKYKTIEATFPDRSQTIPFRHRLAMAYLKVGENRKARQLLSEDSLIETKILLKKSGMGAWLGKGSNHYDLAVDMALLGYPDQAIQNLDSAIKYGFILPAFFEHDPAFSEISTLPAFRKVQDKLNKQSEFIRMAFSNALSRAKAARELKEALGK
jgi:adenylate cyclase